ncbi:hypothetical protein AKJ09_08342 [Labilithrix luteola]|uniref:Uncharacterized protein n=1 Tax=Labilithrix luteola TaxID=1391654 RepID=A0A0K1Q7H3_9BACT|nr:hypothetical protein AKJ09_08342 [Labilithrix luteola]
MYSRAGDSGCSIAFRRVSTRFRKTSRASLLAMGGLLGLARRRRRRNG